MFYFALFMAKLTKLVITIVGKIFKINGSHFPGKVALKLCPDFLKKVGKPKTIITVTGTNGKTTTCNLIIDSLEKNGYKVLNNKTGSNVQGGITTALLNGVKLNNKSKYDIAVLEVDERSSFKIYPYVKPTYAVITNLFRDSLKRNAHSEYIFNIIEQALPDSSTLILNADDLISNRMKKNFQNKKIFFGIAKQPNENSALNNIVNDARICPNCHSKLKYEFIRYHHIGRAYCENCGEKTPKADYEVTNIDYENSKISVLENGNSTYYKMLSDSIFNIYNEIATITVLKQIGLTTVQIQNAFSDISITTARYEKKNINGINIINHLAKGQNPVACSIVFDYVRKEKGKKNVVLLIEDYHDNRESSENIAWLYDCDFEFLNDDSIEKILIGGIRQNDINFRLLLAGIPQEKILHFKNEGEIANNLIYTKDTDIYILYDMYEQSVVDRINKQIEEKITGGEN